MVLTAFQDVKLPLIGNNANIRCLVAYLRAWKLTIPLRYSSYQLSYLHYLPTICRPTDYTDPYMYSVHWYIQGTYDIISNSSVY